MPNDTLIFFLEYKNKTYSIREFSDIEVQICGLEMPVKKTEDQTEPNHALIDWLIDGALEEVFSKPLVLANKLIDKAKSLGWFEANGEFSISNDPITCATTIFKFPEYKSRAFLDNLEAIKLNEKELEVSQNIIEKEQKNIDKIKEVITTVTNN